MEVWKKYKLGQLVELKNGVAFKSNEFIEQGVPVIKIKNVKPNHILLDDLSFVSHESSLNKKCFDILPTDILITMTGNRKDGGADSWVGKVALFNHTGKYLLNQRVSAIRVKENSLVDYVYLSYLLSGWDAQLYFVNHSNSSGGQANISPDIVYNYAVSLPPLSVQYKISSILKSLDDKIEVNRKINENLEQQAQALFKSWFVDFEPFKNGEFVESELGMIPKGWRVVSLADLMDYSGGSQPPASEFIDEECEGYIRFIQIRDYASDSHVTYIPISKKNKLCDVRDIMIARYGASLGRICYGLKGAYNVALAKVYPTKNHYLELLRCYLNTREFYEGINQKGNRAVQAGFNKSDIQSFLLPIPNNEDIIVKFNELCSSMFDSRLSNDIESRRLAELRDTLLPKLMSGELKVNEIAL